MKKLIIALVLALVPIGLADDHKHATAKEFNKLYDFENLGDIGFFDSCGMSIYFSTKVYIWRLHGVNSESEPRLATNRAIDCREMFENFDSLDLKVLGVSEEVIPAGNIFEICEKVFGYAAILYMVLGANDLEPNAQTSKVLADAKDCRRRFQAVDKTLEKKGVNNDNK